MLLKEDTKKIEDQKKQSGPTSQKIAKHVANTANRQRTRTSTAPRTSTTEQT